MLVAAKQFDPANQSFLHEFEIEQKARAAKLFVYPLDRDPWSEGSFQM